MKKVQNLCRRNSIGGHRGDASNASAMESLAYLDG